MATVDLHEARTHLSKLLDRAHAGEEIVIAKAGKPCARLVPITSPLARPARRLGEFKRSIPTIPDSAFFDPLPEEELRLWEKR